MIRQSTGSLVLDPAVKLVLIVLERRGADRAVRMASLHPDLTLCEMEAAIAR